MSFNLIHNQWMPVIRHDGTKEIIAPYQLTENLGINPIVEFDVSRSDFSGSLIQFSIGLVQTTMAPKDKGEWRRGFTSPPSKEKLKDIFETVSQNFDFEGDEARFMQDYELREGNSLQIDKMLMEMPGKNTIENNIDHFLKRNTVKRMCFSCCATALFSLQINAPSGGKGIRTSLRGGGPLTTIVTADNIWDTIWLNVLPEGEFKRLGNFSKTDPCDIFPWIGPTRTSEKQQETTSQDVHPYHMFWSMPRRIRIKFDKTEPGDCDVCGKNEEKLVTTYISKNYGTNYGGAWIHPLSPYTQTKKGDFIPRHAQPGGITYRYWLGLVQNDAKRGESIALSVMNFYRMQHYTDLHEVFRHPPRLWAFGYDFDKAKARCWYESRMPLIHIDEEIVSVYESTIEAIIKISETVANNAKISIKKSMGDYIKGDLSFIDTRFWTGTELEFYIALDKLNKILKDGSDTLKLKREWLKTVSNYAEILFDSYSQSNQLDTSDPKRIAQAYQSMKFFNSEKNKKIADLLQT